MKKEKKSNKEQIKSLDPSPVVLIDKAIESKEEDYIGVTHYVDAIKEAIEQGARVISVNAKYGVGKSSVCKLLAKSDKYQKVSTVSLWDVTIENVVKLEKENKEKQKKVETSVETSIEQPIDLMAFYKSFLFQLAADFHSSNYSRYINKALNKSTGMLNVLLKSGIIKILFICTCVFLSLYFVSLGIIDFNWPWLNDVFGEYITINIDFFRYFLLMVSAAFLICTVYFGKLVYSSWKSESNRELTIDDVTTLYSHLICDSIYGKKKNLIIIEDIDRCINKENKKDIRNFITSLVKLLHYNCKDKYLNKKLKSVCLVLCFDESLIIDESTNEDLLLKLFDYRLSIETIHQEDFIGILNNLLEQKTITKEQKESLMIILDSNKNNIRLIKNTINDAFLKYNTLLTRFPSKEANISFKSCVAYAYLKNYFPCCFEAFINKTTDIIDKTKTAVEQYAKNKKIDISVLKDSAGCGKEKHEDFNLKINHFIEIGYINEDFKLYAFNYPKFEKIKNIYEASFWNFLKGNEPLNVNNNSNIKQDYILECAKNINRIQMNYPEEILKDPYVLKTLLINPDDAQLSALLSTKLELNTDECIVYSNKFIVFLMDNKIPYKMISNYLLNIYTKKWNSTNILTSEAFYDFRASLTKYAKDDIVSYKNLFNGKFESLSKDEYACLNNKELAVNLINTLKFNDDLEDIFLELANIDINLKQKYCHMWSHNILSVDKYLKYAIAYTNEYKALDINILKSILTYKDLLINNQSFIECLNNLVTKITNNELIKLNELNIDFAYSEKSINKFIENKLGITPIIFWLNNEQFNSLIDCSLNDIRSRFVNLNYSEFDYLIEKIVSFKRYILYSSKSEKYDFLFKEGFFVDKYKLVIDWEKVNNVHLLIICNVYSSENIVKNINNRTIKFEDDELLSMLDSILSNINQQEYIKSDLLLSILDNYKEDCKLLADKNNIFIRFIDSIYSDYKYKLLINYQITCETIVHKYLNNLRNYNNVTDKEKYASYVNTLPKEKLSIEIINSINYHFAYNDDIIRILNENNLHKEIVAAYTLRDELYKANQSIFKLSEREIVELLSINGFQNKLLYNNSFANKIKDLTVLQKVQNEFFVELIESNCINYSILIECYLKHINKTKLELILLKIQYIYPEKNKYFINTLANDESLRDFIVEKQGIFKHLYTIIQPNYRHVLTKKLKLQKQK